ncbi:hypothetical protein BKA65DRAFT_393998, partial [Rhexocercosporidium sp. MPI-PUGE-AT-0058]
ISRAEANSVYRQYLINAQKEALINQINKLSKRNLLLTSQIIKNLTEEICEREINKN